MANKIEELIDEIEDLIGSCKYQKFSGSENIIVNKGHIEELLLELRNNTPEALRQSQKIVKQRDEIIETARIDREKIIEAARREAERLTKQARDLVDKLINETDIMEYANQQADEMVSLAVEEARKIETNAVIEANGIRSDTNLYIDSMLQQVEQIIALTLKESANQYNVLELSLNQFQDIISSNRMELKPPEEILEDLGEEEDDDGDLGIM